MVADAELGPENEEPANEKAPGAGGLGSDTDGGAGVDDAGLGSFAGCKDDGFADNVKRLVALPVLLDDVCDIDPGADTFAGSCAGVDFDSLFSPDPLFDSALDLNSSYFVLILCSKLDRSANASFFNAASMLLPSCSLSDSLIPLRVL